MLDNLGMDTSSRIWIQRHDKADFAAEADPAPDWLQQARSLGQWLSTPESWNTALELALWELAGEQAREGLFPWAGWSARQQGFGPGPWAELRLCHWHVSNGQVTLFEAQCPHAENLDRLWAELSDFVTADGLTLIRNGVDRAWIKGELLADLPTASWDKVLGRPVAAFLPESRPLRRLQNELQMWFYTHPLLQGMTRPINSVWVSGTGALTPSLAQWLDQIHWNHSKALPPSGTRVLCFGDEWAQLWLIGGASPWQKLMRRWRPLPWPGETRELD